MFSGIREFNKLNSIREFNLFRSTRKFKYKLIKKYKKKEFKIMSLCGIPYFYSDKFKKYEESEENYK